MFTNLVVIISLPAFIELEAIVQFAHLILVSSFQLVDMGLVEYLKVSNFQSVLEKRKNIKIII